jgi:hypothetical protein
MKHAKTLLAGAIAMLAAAAMASMAMAQVREFGPDLSNFLGEHPRLAEEVRANPSLLDSPQFRRAHPELQQFMQQHPGSYYRADSMPPGGLRGPGAYDTNHQWRDANWWHANDPNWANKNHPEWAAAHPEWNKSQPESFKSQPVAQAHPGMAATGAQAATGQPQKQGHHKGKKN